MLKANCQKMLFKKAYVANKYNFEAQLMDEMSVRHDKSPQLLQSLR